MREFAKTIEELLVDSDILLTVSEIHTTGPLPSSTIARVTDMELHIYLSVFL